MARTFFRRILFTLILQVVFCGGLNANVKLRIYMQDGTLKAGNLVTENDDAFVILTKSGREEVPKSKIMFVNGKTLAQWQARPDKLFQTEILPAEVPNPAYVNDKAAMPVLPGSVKTYSEAVPKISGPINLPDQKKPSSPTLGQDNMALRQSEKEVVEKIAAPEMEPTSENEKPGVSPSTVPPPETKSATDVKNPHVPAILPSVSRGRIKKIDLIKTKMSSVNDRPIEDTVVLPSINKREEPLIPIVRPKRFSRESMAVYHWQRAKDFLEKNQTGRALNELHVATLLDRTNIEALLLMGDLYAAEQVLEKAAKIYQAPILKKNAHAKDQLAEIEKRIQQKKKTNLIFQLIAAGGVVGSMMSVVVFRWIRSKFQPSSFIVQADSLEQANELLRPEQSLHELVEAKPEMRSLFSEQTMDKDSEIGPDGPIEPPKKDVPETNLEVSVPISKPPVIAESVIPPPPVIFEPISQPEPPPSEQKLVVAAEVNQAASEEREVILKALDLAKKMAKENEIEIVVPKLAPVNQPQQAGSNFERVNVINPSFDDREELIKVGKKVDKALQDGHTYAQAGDILQARKKYRTALALQPNIVEAFLGLGYLDFMEERWEQALYEYERALGSDPQSIDALYGIGRVYMETNRADQASEYFRRALQINPQFNEARDSLALMGKAA